MLDKNDNQDEAWKLLQNDEEGFIRDWIVANVPDSVIFKMVDEGAGNLNTAGLDPMASLDSVVDLDNDNLLLNPETGDFVSALCNDNNTLKSESELQYLNLLGMNDGKNDHEIDATEEDMLCDDNFIAKQNLKESQNTVDSLISGRSLLHGKNSLDTMGIIGSKGDCGVGVASNPLPELPLNPPGLSMSLISADGEGKQKPKTCEYSLLKGPKDPSKIQFISAPQTIDVSVKAVSMLNQDVSQTSDSISRPKYKYTYPVDNYQSTTTTRFPNYRQNQGLTNNNTDGVPVHVNSQESFSYVYDYPQQKIPSVFPQQRQTSMIRSAQPNFRARAKPKSTTASTNRRLAANSGGNPWYNQAAACSAPINHMYPTKPASTQPQIRCIQVGLVTKLFIQTCH